MLTRSPLAINEFMQRLLPALGLLAGMLVLWMLAPEPWPESASMNAPLALTIRQTLNGLLWLSLLAFMAYARAAWRWAQLSLNHEQQRVQNQLFASALAQTRDLVAITDVLGSIQYINPALEQLSGRSLQSVQGQNINLFKSGDNDPALYQRLWEALDAGDSFECVMVNRGLNGQSYLEKKQISAIRDGSGRITHFVSTGRDVTGQLQTEERLRMIEESFAQAMRGAYEGIWDWNLETQTLYFSPSWKAMLGYGEDEVEHHFEALRRLIHPEDLQRVLDEVEHYLGGDSPRFESEFRLLHKDGRWVEVHAGSLLARDHRNQLILPRRLVGTCIDISERRQAEREIRLLGRALQEVNNGVMISYASPDYPVLFVNDAYVRITGLTRENTVGKPCWLYQPGTTGSGTAIPFDRLAAGQPHYFELEHRRADDSRYWVEIHGSPLMDEAGTVTHWVNILVDSTQRKETERALIEARDAAMRANRAKTEFHSTMNHELRTPLNSIIGMAQLLLETQLTSKQRQYSELINKAGLSLLGIVKNMLDFSRMEAGQLELMCEPFDPVALAQGVINDYLSQADAKGVALALHVDDDNNMPRSWDGDPGRVRQVLLNLLDNAVKFTAQGRIDVRLSITVFGYLCLEVEDTGIGIAPDVAMIMFQPYTQGDSSLSRCYEGIGLGLAISRCLTEMMGGKIDVESTFGQGSHFWIELPPGGLGDSRYHPIAHS